MTEQRLWAPWRLEYIKGDKPDECIFCLSDDTAGDRDALVVHRGDHVFTILNAFPYANGHLMVTPYEHVPSIDELDPATLTELMTETQDGLAALGAAYSPEGFNIGLNQGKVAGAGVEEHVHLHVVPRWGGDTNFMPVIGGARVLPQSLDDSWKAVTGAWPTR
jgi:ATP adenylyltransferase